MELFARVISSTCVLHTLLKLIGNGVIFSIDFAVICITMFMGNVNLSVQEHLFTCCFLFLSLSLLLAFFDKKVFTYSLLKADKYFICSLDYLGL